GHRGRHYRIGHRTALALYRDPDTWLAGHEPRAGSWWPEWAGWLARQSSGAVPARTPGTAPAYPALERAPGTYIHQT
ncbi:MAG TPA: poly-beta-hydroxybutyrate polymerase, partial [Roseovarius sp.]|nr:poly-beta-hydroxybutyrate polymerase [Roseovarius sp.]